MAFQLQGNARSLSFDNEVKGLASPSRLSLGEGAALGKPRVRKPPPPPKAPAPQPTTRMSEAPERYAAHGRIATPAPFAARIATPIAGLREARGDYRPALDDSLSDEQPTMALDREHLDVLPGGRIPVRPSPAAGRPIPNFRAPAPAPLPNVIVRDSASAATVKTRAASGAWLAWIAASVLLGFASFHYAPTLLAKVAHRGHAAPHVTASANR